MHLSLVGINYQTAPMPILEKAAISLERLPDALAQLRSFIDNGVILSTCNRTEIYATGNDSDHLKNDCLEFLKSCLGESWGELSKYTYVLNDRSLSEHLFRVACGLESMVIGEHEVLGQVRQALEAAEKAGVVNQPLRHLFYSAIRTGRRVREETGISKYALSLSSVAVNLALDIMHNQNDAKLMVMGAGEAGKQAVKVAVGRGLTDIVVVSRTKKRSVSLTTEFKVRAAGMEELMDELADSNIVITCAASPHPILHSKQVMAAMEKRPHKPMAIIDIAVPRNVALDVQRIENVRLYDMDALKDIIGKNQSLREMETASVESILQEELGMFSRWWQTYMVRPAIKSLMAKAEKIRAGQYHKSIKQLNGISDRDKKIIDQLTRSIVDKILRDPILYLKTEETDLKALDKSEVISKLFRLDEKEQ